VGFSHRATETQRGKEKKMEEMAEINKLTEKIIGCAIEVHRVLGPGLLESVYEEALCVELSDAGLKFQRQVNFPALYKGRHVGQYRIDLIVEESVIVELKSVDRHDPVFEAQILTYLRVTGKKIGLLINFNSKLLKSGVKRFAL
jgi:GxxExxY protein